MLLDVSAFFFFLLRTEKKNMLILVQRVFFLQFARLLYWRWLKINKHHICFTTIFTLMYISMLKRYSLKLHIYTVFFDNISNEMYFSFWCITKISRNSIDRINWKLFFIILTNRICHFEILKIMSSHPTNADQRSIKNERKLKTLEIYKFADVWDILLMIIGSLAGNIRKMSIH
jgi:hypothetical protein